MRTFLGVDDKALPANQLAASLIELAVSRGVNRDKLLRGTGIFIEDINRAQPLAANQLLNLIAQAKRLMAGYDCAFQLGQRLFPGNYGAVSDALLHSRDLNDFLRVLARLRMLICPFVSASIHSDQQRVYLLLNDSLGSGVHWQFLVECYCTALVSACKYLSGRRIPLHFDLPFSRPRYIQEYEANLGLRVNFNQPLLAVSFERHWLDTPFLQASRPLKRCAIQQARQQLHSQQGLLDAVRQILLTHPQASLQQVAEHFAISPATFKRKLRQHNSSFQGIHDEIRKQQAVYLLRMRGLNNEESARQMAFTDIPNFRRAVKRWTGLTPSQIKSTG